METDLQAVTNLHTSESSATISTQKPTEAATSQEMEINPLSVLGKIKSTESPTGPHLQEPTIVTFSETVAQAA